VSDLSIDTPHHALAAYVSQPGGSGPWPGVVGQGETVVDLWGGVRNKATGEPWKEDTMVLVYSATKGFAAMTLGLAHSRRWLDEEPSRNELSRERCNVGSNVISVPTAHRKIHLCVRADECGHEIILIKSVFSTNYLKGRRVRNCAPQTSANDVACRASILSYMPASLNIPSICRSCRKGQRKASSKAKGIVSHKIPPFNQ
jgi:hypothetical protein